MSNVKYFIESVLESYDASYFYDGLYTSKNGNTCIAVVVENVDDFVAVMDETLDCYADEDCEDYELLEKIANNTSSDKLGDEYVVYWEDVSSWSE